MKGQLSGHCTIHVNKMVFYFKKNQTLFWRFQRAKQICISLSKARRKRLLTANDWKLLMKFAKDTKECYDDRLSSSGIWFYLDAKHFIYKTNPMDQVKAPKCLVWRKKNEGLFKGCT